VLGAAVVGVSASAHAGAGGHWPPGGLALGAWLILSSAFAAALGGEARLARIAGLQVGGQAGLHALLALAHPGAQAAAWGVPAGGHLHSGSLAGGARPTASLVDGLLAGGWPMLLAHLAAAAVLTGWLRAGERAVWVLLAGLGGAAAATWSRSVALAAQVSERPIPVSIRLPRVVGGAGPGAALIGADLLRAAPRRGPPAAAAA
jgi:hypothetical protein